MFRYLIIGDPHCRTSDLDDVRAMLDYALKTAIEHRAVILILGDLYHYHGVIHAEVMYLWWEFFRQCKAKGVGVISLVGNHDRPGVAGSPAHSLIAHVDQIFVVAEPEELDGLLFVPYCSNEELVAAANARADLPTVVCHATFDGSKYENGMYANDGLDPARLPQKQIVSGHIHAPQEFGNVWHPGAPRALTRADANVGRDLWLVDFQDGLMVRRQPFSLAGVCRQVFSYEDTPSTPIEVTFDPRHRYHIDIIGPASWIEERKPLYEGKAKVRTFRTDKPKVKLRESDGIGVAFKKFRASYQPTYGTSHEKLEQMLQERNIHV